MKEPDQFGVEFRLFPNDCKAHLFLNRGPQFAFKATNLLMGKEAFVYSQTPEDMTQQLIERFQIGMQRMVEKQSVNKAA